MAARVSPVPSTHSVRRVFPSTVGRRLSQNSSLPLAGLLELVPLSPGLTMSRGLVALAGNPLTVSPVRCVCRPTGPWLSAVYHARTCKRYYGLMRQSGGLRPVYGLSRPVFALAGCPPHLPFFALTHALRPCRYLYPADCPSSFDGSSPGHTSLHRLLSGSAVSVCPLTGFREVCVTRQQYSLHLAACTLAGAADQSPPALARRQARPFTAELAPARVSSDQGLLSLLGPTTYCRGGILTRSRIKERRLHQEHTESTARPAATKRN
jgi:hypothetical protein